MPGSSLIVVVIVVLHSILSLMVKDFTQSLECLILMSDLGN